MKLKKIQIFLLTMFLVVSCFCCCFLSTNIIVHASTESGLLVYSNVLYDLKKDSNFNADNYSSSPNNYGFEVITVAESENKELFVYVYQGNEIHGKYIASSINISLTQGEKLNVHNYKLILVNYEGVFQKYIVSDLEVKDDLVRYYEIISIFRPFDNEIDNVAENNNSISEVVYPVAKSWSVANHNGQTLITSQDVEMITITSKYVGFVRYEDGRSDFWFKDTGCDRHFVSFSTDKNIDKLMEADVYFRKQSVHFRDLDNLFYVDSWSFGDIEEGYSYLTYSQKGTADVDTTIYEWDRIQTIDEFKSSVNFSKTYSCGIFDFSAESKINDEELSFLEQQQWVLSFLETDYQHQVSNEEINTFSTRVSDVTILRLKFESEGVVYNLGVIDNKQGGNDVPINEFNVDVELDIVELIKRIIMIIAVVLLIVILLPLLPQIINFVITIFRFIFKSILFVIKLPFDIVNSIKNKRKNNRKEKEK